MKEGYTYSQAMAEANRCLLCHEPPCSVGCPASTDPGKFIRQMRFLNLKGAAATVKRNNALGGACGILCPTCSLCQGGCTAAGLDRPIDIGGLQRFLIEYAWEIGFNPLEAGEPKGVKVAIVGAGPAGLSCASELAQAGFDPTVFEARDRPGGVLQHVLPDHRMSVEFLDREIRDLTDIGVNIDCGKAVETTEDVDALFARGFNAIYLATGAWASVSLDIPGSESGDVHEGIEFLRKAKADAAGTAALVAGKKVAVIGGGDTAMDVAVSAVKAGAGDVFILYRRSFQQMPGDEEEKLAAIREGVHFMILTQPIEYLLTDGRVTGVKAESNELGEPDSSGRRRPVALPGSAHVIAADIVVEAIGLKPRADIRRFAGLDIDQGNRILVAGAGGQTTMKNVYAGGDAVRGAALISNAICDGRSAAAAIIKSLAEGEV